MDSFWTEIGSVSLCDHVTVECLGKDTVTPKIAVETEVSGCVSRRHLQKFRLTNGKCKVIHKLRGIKFLLNERMYIKVALACYRLINLGGYQV